MPHPCASGRQGRYSAQEGWSRTVPPVNPVRSGRKQPQRTGVGSRASLPPYTRRARRPIPWTAHERPDHTLPRPRPRLPAKAPLRTRRPGRARAHAHQRDGERAHRARLSPLRHTRRRQDDDGPDHRQGAELRRPRRGGRADARALRRLRPLRLDPGGAVARRDRDGRGLAHRQGRRARTHRGRALRADRDALQGLRRRRGPHALGEGVQRPSQDDRGAAAAREVRLRHDRGQEGARHRALALPAVRPAPGRAGGAGGASGADLRQGRRSGGARGAGADRPRSRGFGARFAFPARPGHRDGRGAGRSRDRGPHAGARRPNGAPRPVRPDHGGRRGQGARPLRRPLGEGGGARRRRPGSPGDRPLARRAWGAATSRCR